MLQDGNTPLKLAEMFDKSKVAALLREHGGRT